MLDRNGTGVEFGAVDLMKVLAAVLVVYIHTEPLLTISPVINFVLLNGLARIAVPFFFLTSGYFFYAKAAVRQATPGARFFSDHGLKYLKRIITLYFAWSLIYFPFMVYDVFMSQGLSCKFILECLRRLLYTGTNFQLWYFPALLVAIMILDFWLNHFSLKTLLITAAFLYLVGLGGESYLGMIPEGLLIFQLFKLYFRIFVTTRNGLFFGLMFVTLGAYLCKNPLKLSVKSSALLAVISLGLLITEASLLANYSSPKDYNLLVFAVPAAIFLFQALIRLGCPWKINYQALRKLSTLIYCTQGLFLIGYPVIFRCLGLEILSKNGMVVFILTFLTSLIMSGAILKMEKSGIFKTIARKLI